MRIGFGFDVHRLAEGESLIIGGVNIPHHKGTVAHSDGDVLIHAICDALLGAVNLGDIGKHFPDTSNDFKDIDSKVLLKRVMELLRSEGYELGNLDTTISLQKPKVSGYISQMQEVLAEVMKVSVGQVSVKATTTEKLGYVGAEEGINAHAVVLLISSKTYE